MDSSSNNYTKSSRFSFTWTIDGFDQVMFKNGDFLESPAFSLRETIKSDWKLVLHPVGRPGEEPTSMALHVLLLNSYGNKIKAKYTFSILNENYENIHSIATAEFQYLKPEDDNEMNTKPNIIFDEYILHFGTTNLGNDNFFDLIQNAGQEYLVDGSLILYCDLALAINTAFELPSDLTPYSLCSTSNISTFESNQFYIDCKATEKKNNFSDIVNKTIGRHKTEWLMRVEKENVLHISLVLCNAPPLWSVMAKLFIYINDKQVHECTSDQMFNDNITTKMVRTDYTNHVRIGVQLRYTIEHTPVIPIGRASTDPADATREQPQTHCILSAFRNIFKERKYTDVTLNVQGKEIEAHKVILSARSPVFHNLLEDTINDHIDIDDVDYQVMHNVIEFIYTDVAPDIEEITTKLMFASAVYSLDGLKHACESILRKQISTATADTLLLLAHSCQADNLKDNVIDFIVKHKTEFKDKSFLKKVFRMYPDIGFELFQKG